MKSTLQALGFAFGTLSVVVLFWSGIGGDLTAPLAEMLRWYDGTLKALFWWMPPLVKRLARGFDWEVELQPIWHHVFVLMTIYFSGDWRSLAAAKEYGRATLFGAWGLMVALAASIGVGIVAIDLSNVLSNALVAGIPVAGYLVYAIGGSGLILSWRDDLVGRRAAVYAQWTFQAFLRFALGLALIGIGMAIPAVRSLPIPGLAILGGLVVSLALYWVWVGVRYARDYRREGERWVDAFRRQGNAKVGTTILGNFFGAVLFVALNAGLRLAGLG